MLTVVGEALVDLVKNEDSGRYTPNPGGSPFNVAIALARLGQPTTLLARLAQDRFGRLLRQHAAHNGVRLDAAPVAREPTTLAVVSLDDAGGAEYDFYVNGTADWQWTSPELSLPPDTTILHFGSLASWLPPGDAPVAEFATRTRATTLVTYDPNVRPRLLGAPARGCALIERNVQAAHLVKASEEDVRWLYPNQRLDQVAARWLELGASLVVLTRGGDGATAYGNGRTPLERPAVPADVVDTVGAGDAFMAGLIDGLADAEVGPTSLSTLDDAALARIMDRATLVAALACQHSGAHPPTRADLESAMQSAEASVAQSTLLPSSPTLLTR